MSKQQNKSRRKWLTTIISLSFYALIILGLVVYLQTIDASKLANIQINWWLVGVSMIFGMAFRYWGSYIWLVLLKGLGAQNIDDRKELYYVYAKSWLGRYIPGAATWMLGKVYFASQHGISKNKLTVSSLLEGALQITVLLILSVAILVFDDRLNSISPNIKLILLGILLICIVGLLPTVFNKAISIIYRLVKRKEFQTEHMATGRVMAKGAALYIAGALISGLSLFFAAKAIYPELTYENLAYIIGVGNLAGVIGMLAIFVPSGIGVREGIYIALLSLIMPTEIALVIAVFSRILGIAMDLLFFLIAWCVRQVFR